MNARSTLKKSVYALLFLCVFAMNTPSAHAASVSSISPTAIGSSPIATVTWGNYSEFGVSACGSGALLMYFIDNSSAATLSGPWTNAYSGSCQVGVMTTGGNVCNTQTYVNSVSFGIGAPTAGNHYLHVGAVTTGNNLICSGALTPKLFTMSAAVNGACSSPAAHYSCAAGTSTNNVQGASSYTWWCKGSGGGTTALCSEPIAVNNCSSGTATWTAGGNSCSGPYSTINDGSFSTVGSTDPNGNTGSVVLSCSNGTVTQSSPTCTASGNCPAGTATWTAGGNTCSGAYAAINNFSGSSVSSTNGNTGTVSLYCSGGAVSQSSPSCTAPACTSLPTNATAYAAPDNTGLTANTAYTYSATDTAAKCQYKCGTNYTWNGSSCVANSQTYTCAAKPATGTAYNTVSSYTQTWNGSAWTPASDATTEYNTTASTNSCQYKCASGYTWNGSSCVANSQTYTCAAKPTTGTVYNTVSSYTQTWNGTAWTPASDTTTQYSTTASTNSCQYTCASGYTWNGSSCVASTQTYTCAAKPATGTAYNTVSSYTQTWNGSAWTPASDATTEYNTTASTNSCQYKCASGYTWNGSSCVAPNLTADGVLPTSATARIATPFTSTIRNIGPVGTGAPFNNFMQVATAPNGNGTITDVPSVSMTALVAGGAGAFSSSYTFPSNGSYSVRVCADKSDRNSVGVITESNEGDNCGQVGLGWTLVTVSNAAITGSCSVSPTTGFIGDSFTWSAIAGGGNGTYSYSWTGTDSLSGSGASVTKSYTTTGTKTGSVIITSGGNSSPFACSNTATVNPCYGQGCGPGGGCAYPPPPAQPRINVPSQCCSSTAGVCPALPTATLSANPSTIDQGQSSTLTWSSTNANSCTGYGFVAGGSSGSRSTGILNTPGTISYQVDCTGTGGTSLRAPASVEVLAPNAIISASPTRVSSGGSSVISWSASGVKSCTVTGPGVSQSGTANASHDFSTGSPKSVPIATQSTYTITCTTNGADISKSVTVNVLTNFKEF